MRPSSVCIPVAKTTPRASPPVALLPLKRRSRAVIRGTPTSTSSAERSAGVDSPVRVERSTSTAPEIRRMSAAMRSPSSTTTTSPGTRSAAMIRNGLPPRNTVTRWGRNCARASTARSACISCTNAKRALSAITSRTAMAMVWLPTANDSAAASHSSNASGWVSWRASSPGHLRPPRRRSSLGPYWISRRRASAADRPTGEARRSRISNSTLSVASTSTDRCAGAPSALSGRRCTRARPWRLNRPSSSARARARGYAGMG